MGPGVTRAGPPAGADILLVSSSPPVFIFVFCFRNGDLITAEKLGRNDFLEGV